MKHISLLISCIILLFCTSCGNSPSIGEQIRAARIQRGLSQQQLAEAVGLTQPALSLIEDGLATPLHTKIEAIEQHLQIRLDWQREHVK